MHGCLETQSSSVREEEEEKKKEPEETKKSKETSANAFHRWRAEERPARQDGRVTLRVYLLCRV